MENIENDVASVDIEGTVVDDEEDGGAAVTGPEIPASPSQQ
jgi:hypothetical protein